MLTMQSVIVRLRPMAKKDEYTLKNLDRRDPKKVAAFRVLVETLEKNGMNTWDARMKARQILGLPVSQRRVYVKVTNYEEME